MTYHQRKVVQGCGCRLLHDDQKESGLLPVLARLVKQFVFKFQTKQHAKDLIQALHVVLRMLERLTREGDLPIIPCPHDN